MDPLRLAVAVGPLALYLLVISIIHMGRRPIVVLGTRDTAVLAVALSGFLFIGPIELFLPAVSAIRYGAWVWLFMGGLYLSVLSLILLGMRPRLVIYGARLEQLRPPLEEIVQKLDSKVQWAGLAAELPQLGVSFYLEDAGAMRNVSLVATGRNQSADGWRRLELALQRGLRTVELTKSLAWLQFSLAGVLLLALVGAALFTRPESIVVTLNDFFRP